MLPVSREKVPYCVVALGFNIMSIYMCIVSVDSYLRMKVSLTLLQSHSVADVKMKNLHVCVFFFLCGEHKRVGGSDKRRM